MTALSAVTEHTMHCCCCEDCSLINKYDELKHHGYKADIMLTFSGSFHHFRTVCNLHLLIDQADAH